MPSTFNCITALYIASLISTNQLISQSQPVNYLAISHLVDDFTQLITDLLPYWTD